VGLVETVTGELFHQVEDVTGKVRVDVIGLAAIDETTALLGHFLGLFLAHGTTQHVRTAKGVTGPGDLVADVQRVVVTHQAQFFDFGLQVSDRLFEIKKIRVHRHPSWVDGQEAGRLIRLRRSCSEPARSGRN